MFDVKESIVALVAPFHKDGSVDFDKLKEILEWHTENRTGGILVLGTTGESSTMTHRENDVVVECTLQTIKGRIPVIVGSGSNYTETVVDKSEKYVTTGVDVLFVISPYYNKANVQGMVAYLATVTDVVGKPVIPYNVPGRTGCSISEETVKVLSKHPNICSIKEANGSITHVVTIAWYLSDGLVMSSGNDGMVIPLLSFGGSGVISAWANIMPKGVHEMVHNHLNENTEAALVTQLHHLDLTYTLFIEVNPTSAKEALSMMSKAVGGYRLPLREVGETHRKAPLREMKEVGLC